jgi:two-component system chemotaxis response regulator CheY
MLERLKIVVFRLFSVKKVYGAGLFRRKEKIFFELRRISSSHFKRLKFCAILFIIGARGYSFGTVRPGGRHSPWSDCMAQQEGSIWQGKSVLVVDDYQAVRKTIKELFATKGLKVSEAASGVEALEKLGQETFDLIVSDLVMAEMDGFELTETVKNNPKYRTVPLVILSTHADSKYIFRALRLGADDYLIKPPTSEMVNIVLARVFSHDW